MTTQEKPLTTPAPGGDPTHVLQDADQLLAITNRVKRAHGQMAAVAKAINTAAFTLISSSLRECITDPDVDSDAVTLKLQKLFLSLA
jgi:DNA-binding FrmR family transcriptional regulator